MKPRSGRNQLLPKYGGDLYHYDKLNCHTLPTGETSTQKGVTWDKVKGKWQARISHGGKRHFLGYFDDERKTAEAYTPGVLVDPT